MSNILDLIFANTPDDNDTAVIERPPVVAPVDNAAPALPPMYAVLLHNDNSTFPDFVTKVLSEAFNVESEEAWKIMMSAHRGQQSVVRIFSKDEAETRMETARTLIAVARPGRDFGRGENCELTFSVRAETKGE